VPSVEILAVVARQVKLAAARADVLRIAVRSDGED
jgi:hypothetical protein